MGDTGSLTIGGVIGVAAVLIRKELLLPLLSELHPAAEKVITTAAASARNLLFIT